MNAVLIDHFPIGLPSLRPPSASAFLELALLKPNYFSNK